MFPLPLCLRVLVALRSDLSMAAKKMLPGTSDVRLSIDLEAVGRFLSAATETTLRFTSARQFNAGQSNPTYLLESADGKPIVVRRQPAGRLLPSAHDVAREYRVISALRDTAVPVPRVLALCADKSVWDGVQWYAMEFVAGEVMQDDTLPEASPADRRALWLDAARVLATMHSLDHRAIGLGAHGKPGGGYAQRQVKSWARSFRAVDEYVRKAATSEWAEAAGCEGMLAELSEASDGMARLEGLLAAGMAEHVGPPEKEPTCLVHGDYRLGNVITARGPDGALGVAAVLDWELSTLGHPLCDLAYFMGSYNSPRWMGGFRTDAEDAAGGSLVLPPGTPSPDEIIDLYCRVRGVPRPSEATFHFFLALTWHRKAGIMYGVLARAMQGNASATSAAQVGLSGFCSSVQEALRSVERAGVQRSKL